MPLEVSMGLSWRFIKCRCCGACHPGEISTAPWYGVLLIRTRNSHLWQAGISEFQLDFVGLTTDGAQWVVDREICIIEVDYLSVQRFYDSPETHLVLLKADMVIVEELNLADVSPGEYQLLCLLLKLVGFKGVPARAVLVRCKE